MLLCGFFFSFCHWQLKMHHFSPLLFSFPFRLSVWGCSVSTNIWLEMHREWECLADSLVWFWSMSLCVFEVFICMQTCRQAWAVCGVRLEIILIQVVTSVVYFFVLLAPESQTATEVWHTCLASLYLTPLYCVTILALYPLIVCLPSLLPFPFLCCILLLLLLLTQLPHDTAACVRRLPPPPPPLFFLAGLAFRHASHNSSSSRSSGSLEPLLSHSEDCSGHVGVCFCVYDS